MRTEDSATSDRFREGVEASHNAAEESFIAPVQLPQSADTTTRLTVATCAGDPIELNAAEKEMLDIHNRTRSERGLFTLCVHPSLTKSARAHSQDMLNNNYFAHRSQNGLEPKDRMIRSGYTLCGRTRLCGENLSLGAGPDSLPESSFARLMNSPGHRENILRKEFHEVGIGANTGTYSKEGVTRNDVTIYAMNFGGWP